MIITESLAKGLKNRFLLEINEEINARINSTKKNTMGVKISRNGWPKYVEKLKSSFGRCALVCYEGGTKRKPYFAFCGLAIEENKPYNSWNEKCLYVVPMIVNHDPRFAQPSLSLFNLGEHAITRIFQRGDIVVSNESDVDIFSILPEFQLLPLWGSFWARVLLELKQSNPELDVRPVIPGKSGLFFSEYKGEVLGLVEIRTFVDNDQLSDLQREVRKIFIDASEGIEASPMAFFPANEFYGVDGIGLQLGVMSYRLAPHAKKIGKAFFYHIENCDQKQKSIDFLEKWLFENSDGIDEEASALYKNEGIRHLHNSLRDLERRNPD